MPTLNYTTRVSVDVTVGEISKILARNGVATVVTRYDEDGRPDGLGFSLRTPHGDRQFMLDVKTAGVQRLLAKVPKEKQRPYMKTLDHASAVGWRVVKDWVEAQLALVEAEIASLDQVMLPYAIARPDGATLYEVYRERELGAIEVMGER
jgi:hypothetical protein